MCRILVLLVFIIIYYPYHLKGQSATNIAKQVTTIKQVALPMDSAQLAQYIPKGYMLLDSASGDLNRDEYEDMILVLNKPDEKETSDVSAHPTLRPLLLLLGQSSRTYKVVARNDKTVYCVDCGGMMGDPFTQIVIKNGYFSIEHYGGSSWRWGLITTFKYSTTNKTWYLYKQGSQTMHTSDPDKVKTTITTAKNFGIIPFSKYDIYKED